MPTITFTLSADAAAELVDALCVRWNYAATLRDGTPNPETKAQFARRMHIALLRRMVLEYRERAALLATDQTPADIT